MRNLRISVRGILTALFSTIILFAVVGALANAALAQDVASLTGVVTDPSGAVVADVDVTLVDTRTNETYTTKTNSTGSYVFPRVAPGPGYKLTLTKQGFAALSVPGLYLAVSTTHTQNVQLSVGTASETVEVKGLNSGVSLDTTDATVGNNVDMDLVHELPIQIRDSPLALVAMQPGTVALGSGSHDDPLASRDGAVTGSRSDQGNVTLDGLDVNDFATGQSFVAVGNAPVDSIQEFRVETANPLSAEGRGSGAQVNLVTKSGTNIWHGSAYDYNRNTALEANSFFNKRSDPVVPRPNLIRNQFGATVGGPAVKDKLFFFFNYQGRRDHTGDSVSRIVPLDSYRAGNVSYINNGAGCTPFSRVNTQPACITTLTPAQIVADGFDPQNLGTNAALFSFIDQRYPHANDLTLGDGVNTGGFRFNAPAGLTENDYVGRVDYNLTSKMKVFGRFSILRELVPDDVNFSAPEEFPGDPTTHEITDRSWAFVLGHNWTISENKINQFYYGETRSKLGFPTTFNPVGTTDYSVFGNNGSGGSILSGPFQGQSSQARVIPIPVFRDDFTWVKGSHNLQFGGTFKPILSDSSITNDFNSVSMGLGGNLLSLDSNFRPSDILQDPSGVAPTLWDSAYTLALGRIGNVGSNFNNGHDLQPLPQGVPAVRKYRYYETEFYGQDTWKVRSDLTLTYGLRYQHYSVPYEVNGIEAIPNFDLHGVLDPRITAGAQGLSGATVAPLLSYNFGGKANHGARGLYEPDWKDFAPRVSFAYNPAAGSGFLSRLLGDRKTVIRGGGGIVYDHPVTNAINFIQDQVSYIFSNASGTPFGIGGDPQDSLAQDPRFTALGALPPLNPPAPVVAPFTPFVDNTGTAFGTSQGQVNYAIDDHIKTPYALTYTLGFQRELPGNFLVEATYFGRLGRRLISQSDAGQVVNFRDPASGHSLAGDFGSLSAEVRQDPVNLSAVTAQPFFENQIQDNIGVPCTTAFGESCSLLIASAVEGLVQRGDLGDTVFVLQGLLPQNVGLTPQFATNVYISNQTSSSYNGLLTTLHKRMSNGLQFDLNYTFSHSIDNSSTPTNNVFGSGATQGAGGVICDAINLRACRGNSDFDTTHLISGGGLYDLPFGRGKSFGGTMPKWLDEVVGGWQVSTIAAWHTGFAFTTLSQAFPISFVNNTPGVFNGDTGAIRTHIHTSNGQLQLFADPNAAISAFRGPLGLEGGTRNNLRGPHYSNFDIGLGKHFALRERLQMEFRADAFNAFNHPNFGLPQNGATDITNPSVFGVITNTSAPRELQLALRLDF